MKVFLSWSGERSKMVAEALRHWLPLVLHYVESWMSAANIDAGDRWSGEVGNELEKSNFGIVCLTPENSTAPWILFEAGALSKQVEKSAVVPYLFGLDTADLAGPLAQFQAMKADKESTLGLITSINNRAKKRLPEARIPELYDLLWPKLDAGLKQIPVHAANQPPPRKEREILEELVQLVRLVDQRTLAMRRSEEIRWGDGPRAAREVFRHGREVLREHAQLLTPELFEEVTRLKKEGEIKAAVSALSMGLRIDRASAITIYNNSVKELALTNDPDLGDATEFNFPNDARP